MVGLRNNLARSKLGYIVVLAGTAITLASLTTAATADATVKTAGDWGCVKNVSTDACLGNPPSHILQFHNGCSKRQWVQVRFRWHNNPKICEQGGSEPITPGTTGSVMIGLCGQGEFKYLWRACGEPGCSYPSCPDLP